jgi:preprotein translocase subunit SecG
LLKTERKLKKIRFENVEKLQKINEKQSEKNSKFKQEKLNMKRITGFMIALFLVLGIGTTNGLAQDHTMKQTNTMTMQSRTMSRQSNRMTRRKKMDSRNSRMMRKKMMMNKRNSRMMRKKMMMKKSTMK